MTQPAYNAGPARELLVEALSLLDTAAGMLRQVSGELAAALTADPLDEQLVEQWQDERRVARRAHRLAADRVATLTTTARFLGVDLDDDGRPR